MAISVMGRTANATRHVSPVFHSRDEINRVVRKPEITPLRDIVGVSRVGRYFTTRKKGLTRGWCTALCSWTPNATNFYGVASNARAGLIGTRNGAPGRRPRRASPVRNIGKKKRISAKTMSLRQDDDDR